MFYIGNSCCQRRNNVYNSTFDIFVRAGYNSTAGSQRDTSITKVRIVEYPWWNTSWNCRRLINVTQNTGNSGSGIIEVNSINLIDCDIINCTDQIRITEVLTDKSQQYIPYLFVNETQYSIGDPKYCQYPNIKFNATLNAGQTKKFFIYYNNPIANASYQQPNLSAPVIASASQASMPSGPEEFVWDWFYDSHIDFWWTNASDQDCDPNCPSGSLRFRRISNNTFIKLSKISYKTQVSSNRNKENITERLPYDSVYVFYGHGGLYNDTHPFSIGINQTAISPILNQPLFSTNISNITQTLSAKFVMSISSFGGDNSTTLTGCPLNNWLSKAFTEKGADCYLGFLGTNTISSCSNCGCDSDVLHHHSENFVTCFWGNISAGKTISEAKENADFCSKTCGPSINESCTNPILVSRYTGSCNQTLVK